VLRLGLVLRLILPLILGLMLRLILGLGLVVLSLKVGLLLKATQVTLSQRARHRYSAIQTSASCAHSLSYSINGIAGESNETKIEVVRLLHSLSRLFSSVGYLNSRRQAKNSAVLAVSFAV
jgi:hypothetical protein